MNEHTIQKLSRGLFMAALDAPCPAGHGLSGSACWTLGTGRDTRLALCGDRVRAAKNEI